jgi:hypothetical protein
MQSVKLLYFLFIPVEYSSIGTKISLRLKECSYSFFRFFLRKWMDADKFCVLNVFDRFIIFNKVTHLF